MRALKYNDSTGLYRLKMTRAQAQLIARLVHQVRLSTEDDTFKDAAFELCRAFESEGPDFDCDTLSEFIRLDVSLESMSGEPIVNINGDTVNMVFEVSERHPF